MAGQDRLTHAVTLHELIHSCAVLCFDSTLLSGTGIKDILIEGVGLFGNLLAVVNLFQVFHQNVHGDAVADQVGNIKEHIFVRLCLCQIDMGQVVVLAITERREQRSKFALDLGLCALQDRDIDHSAVVTENGVVFLLGGLDDGFQDRVHIHKRMEGILQPLQVDRIVQSIDKGQVAGGISGDDVGKIHHHAGQRISGTYGVVDLFLALFLQDEFLQAQNGVVVHEFCQGHADIELCLQLFDEHDAGEGIHAALVEVRIGADFFLAQDGRDDLVDLLLKLCCRTQQILFLCTLLLPVFKISLTDDLLGGSLLEGLFTDGAVGDLGIRGKFLIVGRDDFVHGSLDILNAVGLCIFVVGVDLDLDAVTFAEGDDILDQTV